MKEYTEPIFMVLNIHGYTVDVIKFVMGGKITVFACYAEVKNSKYLSSEVLGADVTYRKDDELGVSTGVNSWMNDYSDDKKLKSALKMMEIALKKCKKILNSDFE